jgi:hypothetical protein
MEDEMSETNREDLIKRIRNLQAKTVANGCTEAEAMTAADLMARLLDKYGFSQSDLEIKLEPLTEDTFIGPYKDLRGAKWVATTVQEYCDVRLFSSEQSDGRKVLRVFGRETDVATAVYMLHLFATAFKSAWHDYCMQYSKQTGRAPTTDRTKQRKAFDLGMSNRINARLKAMKATRNTAYDPTSKRTGQDLVVVKNAVVDEEFAKRYQVKSGKKSTIKINASAFMAGQAAGDRVAINQGVGSSGAPKAIS